MKKLSRAPLFAALALIGAAGAFSGTSVHPAMALCKYGTPHCVNPNPGPKPPSVGGAQLPDSGWEDPDCKYYNSCGFADPPRTAPSGAGMPFTGQIQTKPLPAKK